MKNSITQRVLTILPVALLTTLPLCSYADYQSELSLNYQHDSKGGGNSSDEYSGKYSYFYSLVSTEELPLREAAFLGKASSVSVSYRDAEEESNLTDEIDSDNIQIESQVVLSDHYIVGLSYADGEHNNFDTKAYGIEGGVYINDTTSLTFSISQIDNDGADDELEEYKLNLRSVVETYNGNSVGTSLSAGTSERETSNTVIEIDGSFDYYFTPKFSVGGVFAMRNPNGDDSRENLYGIKSEYFITENFAIGADFSVTVFQEKTSDVDDDNIESFSISLTGRL